MRAAVAALLVILCAGSVRAQDAREDFKKARDLGLQAQGGDLEALRERVRLLRRAREEAVDEKDGGDTLRRMIAEALDEASRKLQAIEPLPPERAKVAPGAEPPPEPKGLADRALANVKRDEVEEARAETKAQENNVRAAIPVIFMVLIGIAVVLYGAPTFVAISRKHPWAPLIAVLNLLFGFTVIGWLVLLGVAASGGPYGVQPEADSRRRRK